MRLALLALTAAALSSSTAAFAQQEEETINVTLEDGRQAKVKARTEIDFGELAIGASGDGPDISLLNERTPTQFQVLFRLRTDFDEELARSTDEVK